MKPLKLVPSFTRAYVGECVFKLVQSLLLLCADGRLRRLLKESCVFSLLLADGSQFFLHGKHLLHAPASRSKVKLKPKISLMI